MNIVTWNVNSVRARLSRLVPWLEENSPDVLCLQETKVVDEDFPFEYLEDCGYNIEVFGQKTYNGVAILAQHPIEDVVRGFPDDGLDAEKRALGCVVGEFMILNLYVPNGQQVGSEKFRYKLDWMKRLRGFLDERFDANEKVVVTGDFNVTFDDRDVYAPDLLRESIHCSTPEREALREVMGFGLSDGLRRHHEEAGIYTWWDMRGGAFPKNHGMRIDHVLMSDAALEASTDIVVDRAARDGKGPSDHAPVIATFE